MKINSKAFASLKIREKVFVRGRIPEIILLAMVITYSVVFSYLTELKLQAFGMHAWDFGIYLQAIHSTATSGKFFYATPELPYTLTAIPPGTEFAVHFSPILFLVVPTYALFQSAATILAVKAVAIALGAIPVFLLAKKILGRSIWGIVFAACYLLYPAVQGINWYDFEPHIFFPTLVLFTILFIESGRNKLAVLFATLSLSTIEIAPFFMIALGLSYAVIQRTSILEKIRKRRFRSILKSVPFAIILLAIVWLALVFSTSVFLGWQTSFHPSNERRLSIAATYNISAALSYDWQTKLAYLLLVLGPFAFLSVIDPIRLFPGALWLVYALLSNYVPYYYISFQYPSFVIPFVVVSAIFGLRRLQKYSKKHLTKIVALILCLSIGIGTVVASPIGPFHLWNHPWAVPFGIPSMTTHDGYLHELINLIPANASVLTSNDLFPLVAQRLNAYAFPFVATFPSSSSNPNTSTLSYLDFYGTLYSYLEKTEYVLYDAQVDPTATVILQTPKASKDFGLYAEADGAILLRKGYVGNPVYFVPFEKTFNSGDLTPVNSTVIEDPFSESGKVLYHYSPDSVSDFWYGPGVFLVRGTYSVDFRLKLANKVENTSNSAIMLAAREWPANATVEMTGSASMWFIPNIVWQNVAQAQLQETVLLASNFTRQGSYQTFSLQFSVDQPGGLEFVGLAVPKATSMYLDYIKLTQLSPEPTPELGVPVLTPHDQYLLDLAGLIPANHSVLTSKALLPKVPPNTTGYIFPFEVTFKNPADFNSTMDSLLSTSDFIFYDAQRDPTVSVMIQAWNVSNFGFGLYAEADGAILLRKGYVGNPVYFVPFEKTFNSGDLTPVNSTVIQDPLSESGKVLYHYSPDSVSDFWYGPGVFLVRGTYSVDFRLKIIGNTSASPLSLVIIEWPSFANIKITGSNSTGYVPQITVESANQTLLSSVNLQMGNFTRQGSYQTFSLQFSVDQPGGLEFVGLAVPKATSMYLDYIKLTQLSPEPTPETPVVPVLTPHDQYLLDLAGLIPANHSVLTSKALLPKVPPNTTGYIFPFETVFKNPEDFNNTMDSLLSTSDFIFYDAQRDPTVSVTLQAWNVLDLGFGLYAEADGAILLRKGYVGNPVYFVPLERTFRSGDLTPVNSTIIQDPLSESGKVLYHYSPDSVSDFWYGPGVFLARGTYVVSFRLKLYTVSGELTSYPISIAVAEWPSAVNITMVTSNAGYVPQVVLQPGDQIVLTADSIELADFTQMGTYQNFFLEFTVDQPGGFEFVGLQVPGAAGVYLDYLRLSQVAP